MPIDKTGRAWLADSIEPLHPEEQTIEDMLTGWRNQQLCRNLQPDMINQREQGVRGRHPVVVGRQRFPVKGTSVTARHLSRYFARGHGISTYSHISDQHSTFDTKVIVATAPESHYVLDGVLGNGTDLPIVEHATDTPTAPPWRTSRCSTWSASSSRPGSATWARSLSTAPGPPDCSPPATRWPGRC